MSKLILNKDEKKEDIRKEMRLRKNRRTKVNELEYGQTIK
jgi:hypothetical protein